MSIFDIAVEEVDGIRLPNTFKLNGYVYVLENELMPGVYKVGMTTRTVQERCNDISNATGVPVPFKVVTYYHSDDAKESEKMAHELLNEYRINPNREFFKCSLLEIEDVLSECCTAKGDQDSSILAMSYDIIAFNQVNTDIFEQLDDLGVSCLGDKSSLMTMFAMVGVNTLIRNGFFHKEHSMIIDSNQSIKLVKSVERKYKEEQGIYQKSDVITKINYVGDF